MKTLFSFILALSVLLISVSSCTNDMIPENADFSIAEAMAAFKLEYNQALVSTKSAGEMNYSLAGGDYTPQWERSVASQNEYIWSLEIPVLSNYGIVSRNKTTGEIKALERRLVFIKSKATAAVSSYMLILSEKSGTKKSGLRYIHAGSKDGFTGFAMYTALSGMFIQINNYIDGVLENSVNTEDLSSEENHAFVHELSGDEEMGITLYGGGGYPTFEGMCPICGWMNCQCHLEPCVKCGAWPCSCYDVCWYCGMSPCQCHICSICGEIGNDCTCNEVCPGCHRIPAQCTCDPKESYCSDCGSIHMPGAGNCKARCPFCSKLFNNCTCK